VQHAPAPIESFVTPYCEESTFITNRPLCFAISDLACYSQTSPSTLLALPQPSPIILPSDFSPASGQHQPPFLTIPYAIPLVSHNNTHYLVIHIMNLNFLPVIFSLVMLQRRRDVTTRISWGGCGTSGSAVRLLASQRMCHRNQGAAPRRLTHRPTERRAGHGCRASLETLPKVTRHPSFANYPRPFPID